MSYDPDFDQYRLDQLASTHLSDRLAIGDIAFFADDDGRLGKATWRLNDNAYKTLNDSGFKHYLMELLDSLIIYRKQHNKPNSSQGIIYVNGRKLNIEWVTPEEAFQKSEWNG
ncbi:hypothetical protein LWH48_17775 [Halomonas sp. G15]|uniref:hypothetical protein n=1 Tax=Halomonas sp. G15 TaxID=2903521 RepID=UPI001E35B6CB|nr:hypothetical protein [Halomonas sp. G15]MCE0734609.1 hypothetical protein [Halomonas sp. G15]